MRHIVTSASLVAASENPPIQGSEFGFRVLKLTHLPFASAGSLVSQANDTDFATYGPGIFPVVVEVQRGLDEYSGQGVGNSPMGQSKQILVTDGAWQPVPSRYLKIAANQPWNCLGQARGNYLFELADTLSELSSRSLRPGHGDDALLSLSQEFLAPSAVGPAQCIAGPAANPIAGLSAMTVQNLGPNPIYLLEQAFNAAAPTVAQVIANGIAIPPFAQSIAGQRDYMNLHETIVFYIASTALQLAGAGTRVVKRYGSGVRS